MNYTANKDGIVIFGTSNGQKEFENHAGNLNVSFYLDNDVHKQGTIHNNKMIRRPHDCSLDVLKEHLIVIASSFYHEISVQLLNMGLQEHIDFVDMYEFLPIETSRSLLEIPQEFDDDFLRIYLRCRKYTMTTIERMYALYQSICYIVNNDIKGDIVECGVWKGGSVMLCALTLIKLNATDRKIYLYDTFSGMTEPTEIDIDLNNKSATELMGVMNTSVGPKEEVMYNMESTGYPMHNIKFVEGKVEDTIPTIIPKQIALLRLDTDWFESTYHELNYLYPILTCKGILIIDDYGHWQGSKIATDKYIEENKLPIFLHRVDYTGRLAVKVE